MTIIESPDDSHGKEKQTGGYDRYCRNYGRLFWSSHLFEGCTRVIQYRAYPIQYKCLHIVLLSSYSKLKASKLLRARLPI